MGSVSFLCQSTGSLNPGCTWDVSVVKTYRIDKDVPGGFALTTMDFSTHSYSLTQNITDFRLPVALIFPCVANIHVRCALRFLSSSFWGCNSKLAPMK